MENIPIPGAGSSRTGEHTTLVDQERPAFPWSAIPPYRGPPKAPEQPTVEFSHRKYVPFLVAIYSGLAVAACSIQCVLVSRPITAPSYHFYPDYAADDSGLADCFFKKSNRFYQAARVVSAIASLLTLPLASSICAFVAVNFIQYAPRRNTKLTLRRALALANKGWTNLPVLMELVNPSRYKRHYSTFFWLAIVVPSWSEDRKAALNAAVFLASKAVITSSFNPSRFVQNNPGVEIQKPKISTTNMIVVSVLLGLFLSLLMAISVWGSVDTGWTSTLDSLAMTKLGASAAAEPSLYMDDGEKEDKEANSFDMLPGFVGDAEPDAAVGKLALGARAPLRQRRYRQSPDLTL